MFGTVFVIGGGDAELFKTISVTSYAEEENDLADFNKDEEEAESDTINDLDGQKVINEDYVIDVQVLIDEGTFACGDGSEADPFVISCAREFINFRDEVNKGNNFEGKYIKLESDISLKNYCGEGKGDWTPIGSFQNISSNEKAFNGSFDGDGHTVSGLYIENGGDGSGLFSEIETKCTIKNLNAEGFVQSTGKTGGIVAHASRNTVIDNCSFSGTISSSGSRVGGISGEAYNIINCKVEANVTGNGNTGGVVGFLKSGGKIDNCSFSGTISSSGSRVGGISGEAYNIINCKVEADVTGNGNTGGVVGFLKSGGKIDNCSFKGKVTGTSATGGINGMANGNNTVVNCTVSGDVTAAEGIYIGGVSGKIVDSKTENSIVEKCTFESGTVKGPNCVGGIVGGSNSSIVSCLFKGYVLATIKRVGGIEGLCYGPVTGCINMGSVSGPNEVGGIAGSSDECKGHIGTITACINQGDIEGGRLTGGIVGITYQTVSSCQNHGKVNGVANPNNIKGGGNGKIVSSLVTGSTFSNGSLIVLTVFAAAGIAAFVAVILFKKKRKIIARDDASADKEE